jgi:hypothetical protein
LQEDLSPSEKINHCCRIAKNIKASINE